MDSVCRILVLGILGWLTTSCQYMNYSYSGTYFLERSQEVSPAQVEAVARNLRSTLPAFGFTEDRPYYSGGSLVVIFEKMPRSSILEINDLPGSNARFTIAFKLDSAVIWIRDLSNTVETDFMRTLKRSIEQLLEDNGIHGVRFKRQNDVFS